MTSDQSEIDLWSRQGLHVMSKPIGPICNLDCEYCYYLHKEELYPSNKSWRMTTETLAEYIRQYINAQPADSPEITFAWQGGEPTLLKLEFFQRVVEIQKRQAPSGIKIVNTLQTNGVLLDDAWAEFFRNNNFLIGLSIDGPSELHDRYRYDKKGEPTFAKVLKALQLLKQYQVDFNALVVVNRHNGDHGKRVYTYLRDNGVQFIQFIPIVERKGVGVHAETSELHGIDDYGSFDEPESMVSSRSILPDQFGTFLIDVFEEWIRRDVGKVFVQIFDQALSAWMGIEPSLCVFRKECGRAMAIEHNGDVYSCDHFVEPDYLLGNIHQLPIIEMANTERQRKFGRDKLESLPSYCRECEVRFACNGECPKNRILKTPDGQNGLNYLCAGYRKFFNHIDPWMKLMCEELRQKRSPANVMRAFRDSKDVRQKTITSDPTTNNPQRNDPCPCGSGRKFKKCCMP